MSSLVVRKTRTSVGVVLCSAALALVLCTTVGTSAQAASTTETTAPSAEFKAALKELCKAQPLKSPETLTLAWAGPFEVWAPVILAQKFGVFDKQNLTVNTTVQTGPNTVVLLQQGQTDLALTGYQAGQFNALAAGGSTFKYLALGTVLNGETSGLFVASKYYNSKGKLDAESLKGTNLGLSVGVLGASPAPFIAETLKKDYKLDLAKDFHLNGTTSANNYIALSTGGISAGYLGPPESVNALKEGLVKPPIYRLDVPLNAYIGSSDALANKKPALKAFFRAIECTIGTYLQGDYHQKPAVVTAIASASGLPDSAINNGPAQYVWPVNLTLDPNVILQQQQGWLDFGEILTYTAPLAPKTIIAKDILPVSPAEFPPYKVS
jgi:ABC-type nitrate/sulfonate/bicarbonate transport system substrate-binding protein